MRGHKLAAVALAAALLLTGCGSEEPGQYAIEAPAPSAAATPSPTLFPTPAATQNAITPQPTAAQAAEPTPRPAAGESGAQQSDAAVDALLQELDDLGKALDSLDVPGESDLLLPSLD